MSKIQMYINGLVDTNSCNLECSYCYLKLQGYGVPSKPCSYRYDIPLIRKAMSKSRWGTCYISLTGKGETLIDKWVIDLGRALLEEGHYINFINNGTMTENLRYMRETYTHELAQKTMLTFSLHYNEMKRKNLLDDYFENVRSMKKSGFTVYMHLTLADEYIPYLDEIRERCLNEVGILPQAGIVRDETDRTTEEALTQQTIERYYELAASFHSPYFELSKQLYEEKCNGQYCYAGELGVLINFSTGHMKQCLCNEYGYNIFENPDEPVALERVGSTCKAPWCYNPALQIFGMIPGKDYPLFSAIFAGERRSFTSDVMIEALDVKLADEFINNMHS